MLQYSKATQDALYEACGKGDVFGVRSLGEFVQYELSNVGLKSSVISVAFFRAVEKGHMNVVKELISLGVSVSAKDGTGWTGLHAASAFSQLNLAKFFVSQSILPTSVTDYGRTPLHFACDVEMVDFLLMYGANIEALDCQQETPLCFAVERSRAIIVRRLLQLGANPKFRNKKILTIKSIAKRSGSQQICEQIDNALKRANFVSRILWIMRINSKQKDFRKSLAFKLILFETSKASGLSPFAFDSLFRFGMDLETLPLQSFKQISHFIYE